MASTDRQRWARVQPHMAWKQPGLPTPWSRVYDCHPDPTIATEVGYVWVESAGKLLHGRADWLEFSDEPRAV